MAVTLERVVRSTRRCEHGGTEGVHVTEAATSGLLLHARGRAGRTFEDLAESAGQVAPARRVDTQTLQNRGQVPGDRASLLLPQLAACPVEKLEILRERY